MKSSRLYFKDRQSSHCRGLNRLDWENQLKTLPLKTPSSYPSLTPSAPPFFPVNFSPKLSTSSAAGMTGNELVVSSSRCSLLLLPPHPLPLLQYVVHPMGDSPPPFLQCASFLQSAVLHDLPYHGFFPWAPVLQEETAPVCVPHGVTRPSSKGVPAWTPLSSGSQVLPGACSSTDFITDKQHSHAPAWGTPWAAGAQLLHHGLHHTLPHRLQGNISAPDALSPLVLH